MQESSEQIFIDVDVGHWANSYINTAFELTIISGTRENTFGLSENLTREDLAVILYRVAEKLNIEVLPLRELEVFTDGWGSCVNTLIIEKIVGITPIKPG